MAHYCNRHGLPPLRRFLAGIAISGLASLAFTLCAGIARSGDPGAPAAPRDPVADTYHGVRVEDPYRWLENTSDPKVVAWTEAEDARARKYLDGLPQRKPIYEQLYRLNAATSSSYSGLRNVGDQVFATYTQPPKQQPMIAVLGMSLDTSTARIVVDPNVINPKGTTAIDWFVPSPDGKLVAVSMSENGSENGTLYLFDVATGTRHAESIPRVQYPTGGGSLAWRSDSSGFWYTRYPGAERPPEDQHFYQQVYFHKLGEAWAKDAYVIGKDFPKVAEIFLDNRFDPAQTLITVANGDGGEFEHFIIDSSGTVHQFTHFNDKIVAASVGADHALYLISRLNAPRGKLLRLAAKETDLTRAAVVVPEADAVMQGGGEFGGEPVVVTTDAIYVRELVGGPSRVAIYDHAGKSHGELPLPGVATVAEVEPMRDGSIVYSVETYLKPPYFSRYDERTQRASETPLAETSPVSFADAEVVREFATSKDGTRVPLNIIRRKNMVRDGKTPVLLTGYGGYGVNLTPQFQGANRRLWLDAGGVFVIANLRGGGEFGETWHEQGSLTKKQNVFDDFIASAQYLIAQHYTDPKHLAIIGGSNGGLLMGAAFTQHPELFRAVVSQLASMTCCASNSIRTARSTPRSSAR